MIFDPGTPLTDPPSSSVIIAASLWTQGALTGPLAASIAVIAVAALGLFMLAGRVDVRRGLSVLTGCFVLFGAPVIAEALLGIERATPEQVVVSRPPMADIPQRVAGSARPADAFDPYAGASVPR